MKTWEDFLPEVAPDVAGCPEPIMLNAIRNAAIKFCNRSEIWQYELDPISVSINVREYELDPPPESRVVRVIDASYDESPIFPKTVPWLNAQYPNWRNGQLSGHYVAETADAILLTWDPPVAVANGLVVRVVLKPTQDSSEAEEILYDDWAEVIAHGALSRLMAQPRKSWSDPKLALYHDRQFKNGILEAQAVVAKSNTQTSVHVVPRRGTL